MRFFNFFLEFSKIWRCCAFWFHVQKLAREQGYWTGFSCLVAAATCCHKNRNCGDARSKLQVSMLKKSIFLKTLWLVTSFYTAAYLLGWCICRLYDGENAPCIVFTASPLEYARACLDCMEWYLDVAPSLAGAALLFLTTSVIWWFRNPGVFSAVATTIAFACTGPYAFLLLAIYIR